MDRRSRFSSNRHWFKRLSVEPKYKATPASFMTCFSLFDELIVIETGGCDIACLKLPTRIFVSEEMYNPALLFARSAVNDKVLIPWKTSLESAPNNSAQLA